MSPLKALLLQLKISSIPVVARNLLAVSRQIDASGYAVYPA
jgi:hypothetical protein